jgi:hypothetical protein
VKKTYSPVLAYWLLPAEPFAAYLAILIRTLAERFDAPIFAPRMEFHAGPGIVGNSCERILLEATRKHSQIVLRHEGIRHSDQFTKDRAC